MHGVTDLAVTDVTDRVVTDVTYGSSSAQRHGERNGDMEPEASDVWFGPFCTIKMDHEHLPAMLVEVKCASEGGFMGCLSRLRRGL